MAAFKKRDRDGYWIRPTLPEPFGRVGPWATGFSTKKQADTVEVWLQQLVLERPEIVQTLIDGRFGKRGLQRVWVAKLTGKLDDLMISISDPTLAEVATELAKTIKDDRVRTGLLELPKLAIEVERSRQNKGRSVRLSWLLASKNVSDIYTAALATGRAPNSVRRSIHRAVSELLKANYGIVRRDAIMSEVSIPSANDERRVKVTSEEIAAILRECGPMFSDFPALAMLLAVDRGPLLRITPRYFDEVEGTLEVLDDKTDARPRTITLSSPAWSILRRRCSGRKVDERIFEHTPSQVRHLWEAARDRAAGVTSRNQRERKQSDPIREKAEQLMRESGVVTLPLLRFKDLRHLLPTAWNALGLSPKDLQEIMGHASGSKQTDRYITARVSGDRERMDQVAAYLGLDRMHLKAAGE